MGLVEREKGVIPQILPLERSPESGPCNESTNATTEIPEFLLKQREFVYKRVTELQKDELWKWNRIFKSYMFGGNQISIMSPVSQVTDKTVSLQSSFYTVTLKYCSNTAM